VSARVVVLLCVLVACKGRDRTAAPPASAEKSAPADAVLHARNDGFEGNVLVIFVDTLRADRLGTSGYRRDGKSLTPNIDAFAATATRFTRAHSQGANTPRSYPSLMTSRLPSHIAFHKAFHNFPAVLDENLMLFEVLAGAGLKTIGFSSHFYFFPRRNATQGFAEFDNAEARDIAGSNTDYAAPRIVPKVVARLDELSAQKTRFAMFVHLFEPHSTYIAHPEFPTHEQGEAGLSERYDYEIAIDDQWIGKIFDELERTHLADHTVVVLVSDHGEAFGTHSAYGTRAFFHGQTLYEEILRVPLMIRIPGIAPSTRDDLVSLLDLAPTIVDTLGLAIPTSFDGRSLLPLLRGHTLEARPVLAEIQPTPDLDDTARAFITEDGAYKLILTKNGERAELYDLKADPNELKNLAATSPELVEQLRVKLASAFAGSR
jgi:arylsulfatase A-like enzyme